METASNRVPRTTSLRFSFRIKVRFRLKDESATPAKRSEVHDPRESKGLLCYSRHETYLTKVRGLVSTQPSLLQLYHPLPTAYVTNVPQSNDHQRPSGPDERPLFFCVLLTFFFLFDMARKILVLFTLLVSIGPLVLI